MRCKFFVLLFCLLFGSMITGLPVTAKAEEKTVAEENNKLNPELSKCLKEQIGDKIFEEIKSGERQPTAEEGKKGEICFQKYGQDMGFGKDGKPKDLNFSPDTDSCLKKKLGSDYKDKLAKVKSREEGERIMGEAESCFGGPGGKEKMPDSVRQCIIKTAGEAEANKMFSGERPSSDSAIFKKLENAGCFKDFSHRGGPGGENLSPEKQKCIEGIMGKMDAEPTEEQKKQVGEKCFGGGPGGRPQLPEAVESCLREKLGSSFMDKPKESMSPEEKNLAGECFRKNNFQPEGGNPGNKGPEMSAESKSCIEGIIGQPLNGPINIGDEAKNRINKECFGGKADQITGEGGPRGATKQEANECANRVTGGAPGPYSEEIQQRLNRECYSEQQTPNNDNPRANPDTQACVDRIASDTSVQMSYEEKQAKINTECFKGERYGEAPRDDSQSGPNPADGTTQGSTGPGGCTTKECAEQYCQANPGACSGQPPQ